MVESVFPIHLVSFRIRLFEKILFQGVSMLLTVLVVVSVSSYLAAKNLKPQLVPLKAGKK